MTDDNCGSPIVLDLWLAFSCSAAACNVAVRILSPKFERLSYRFSKAIQLDTYSGKDNKGKNIYESFPLSGDYLKVVFIGTLGQSP